MVPQDFFFISRVSVYLVDVNKTQGSMHNICLLVKCENFLYDSSMKFEHSLPINLNEFGFVEREQKDGVVLKNRCGRDFLYYVLHYYFPKEFSPRTCGPVEIEKKKIFGTLLPSWLIWTCLPFYKVPRLLIERRLVLVINKFFINSFFDFFRAMVSPKRLSADEALHIVESTINNGSTCGIDMSIGLGGLNDHVLFVFGYDSKNLYVFDTYIVQKIRYQKVTPPSDNRFIMKLPKETVRNMWSRFGRVWVVERRR